MSSEQVETAVPEGHVFLKVLAFEGTSRYVISVIPASGMFHAAVPDGEDDTGYLVSSTLDDLVEKLRKRVTAPRVRVEVPLSYLDIAGVEDCIATGLHAKTQNVLVRHLTSGKTEQALDYRNGTYVPRLSEEDKREYLRLREDVQRARVTVDAWVRGKSINLKAVVTQKVVAITQALVQESVAREQAGKK